MGTITPPADQVIHWILTRRGQSVICTSVPTPQGFDLVLTLEGYATEEQICTASPGSPEQITGWRNLYWSYGWRP